MIFMPEAEGNVKRIAITGANGTIGNVLRKGLKEYEITLLDLPVTDVRDYERLLEVLPTHDVVVHLAWDTQTENFRSGKINPENALMTYNVYRAAIDSKVRRVIMASSVHADGFYNWKGPEFLSPERAPEPDSPYGADKVFMEALGKYYSKKGLEVVCIRLGVNAENRPPGEHYENAVWLSHEDCVELIRSCMEAKDIPGNFFIVYGVSDNGNRIHDFSNPLGWHPKDNADSFLHKRKG